MKKIVFIIVSIIIGLLVYQKNDEIIIPDDAIRVRIIANSNSINDLYQKKQLKEAIKKDLYDLIKNKKSSKEASDYINNNIDKINNIVSQKISNYKINYGLNYFPSKSYKGVIYPSGYYNSLVITLGKGLGDNWWCVLYPPLCMIEDNETLYNVQYRLLALDIINN